MTAQYAYLESVSMLFCILHFQAFGLYRQYFAPGKFTAICHIYARFDYRYRNMLPPNVLYSMRAVFFVVFRTAGSAGFCALTENEPRSFDNQCYTRESIC